MAAMDILFLLYATAGVCEGMCASLCLGDWQAPSERSLSGQPSLALPQCCVSAAVVWGQVTQRQVVCTRVCARVPPRVGGSGPMLCGCALRFPVWYVS